DLGKEDVEPLAFGAVVDADAAGGRRRALGNGRDAAAYASFPWHSLNFLPLPQGHGSFRPTLGTSGARRMPPPMPAAIAPSAASPPRPPPLLAPPPAPPRPSAGAPAP